MHRPDCSILEDMDRLPSVTDVYKRDLHVEDYFIVEFLRFLNVRDTGT